MLLLLILCVHSSCCVRVSRGSSMAHSSESIGSIPAQMLGCAVSSSLRIEFSSSLPPCVCSLFCLLVRLFLLCVDSTGVDRMALGDAAEANTSRRKQIQQRGQQQRDKRIKQKTDRTYQHRKYESTNRLRRVVCGVVVGWGIVSHTNHLVC